MREIKENFLYNLHKFLSKSPIPAISSKTLEISPFSQDFQCFHSNPIQRDSVCTLKLEKNAKTWESVESALFPLYFRAKPVIFTIEIRSNEDSESLIASKISSSLTFNAKEPEITHERLTFKAILKELEAGKTEFQRLCDKKLLFSLDHMVFCSFPLKILCLSQRSCRTS